MTMAQPRICPGWLRSGSWTDPRIHSHPPLFQSGVDQRFHGSEGWRPGSVEAQIRFHTRNAPEKACNSGNKGMGSVAVVHETPFPEGVKIGVFYPVLRPSETGISGVGTPKSPFWRGKITVLSPFCHLLCKSGEGQYHPLGAMSQILGVRRSRNLTKCGPQVV